VGPGHRYDGFAIDLDGVVWLSRDPIPGSAEAIERLRAAGHGVVFVTNDPRSTRAELATRLGEIGAPTEPETVLTSATAAAFSVAAAQPGGRVLAVGTDSLRAELAGQGLEVIAAGVKPEPGSGVDAVVVGGGAGFDQDVLRLSSSAVRDGARLWATNKDPVYPTATGPVPGTGALVAAIEVASGERATNVGKPEPALFEAALLQLDCRWPLMAGDSLHSDVAGAAAAGMSTALVLSGRDGLDELAAAASRPDHVFEDLSALAAELT
jgi:HAD superfamily hydrolase (TIGR01450 family)